VPVVMVTSGSKVAAFDFLCMVCPRIGFLFFMLLGCMFCVTEILALLYINKERLDYILVF
jgi:hypothetical protein